MKLKFLLFICFSIISGLQSMRREEFRKLNAWYDITNFKKEIYEEEMQYGAYQNLDLEKNIKKVYFYNRNKEEAEEPYEYEKLLPIPIEKSKEEVQKEKITFAYSPRIVLFVIHGTGSSEKPWYFDYYNETFRAILNFARSMASANPFSKSRDDIYQNVEVVSFSWSGANNIKDRQDAGKALAELINRNYSDKYRYQKLITFAHSHGGNVVNEATKFVKNPIDIVINLFTPAREKEFIPNERGFKGYFNFWSSNDQIQFFGSFSFGSQENADVAKSEQTTYSQLALETLAMAGTGIAKILSGGRKLPPGIPRVINLRLLINGIAPAHIEGKKTFISNLKSIFDTFSRLYRVNDDFDVNIDISEEKVGVKQSQIEDIYMAIRNPLEIEKAKSNLGLNDQQINELQEELKREESHSIDEAARFKRKYKGESIRNKGLIRIPGFINEWLKFAGVKERIP